MQRKDSRVFDRGPASIGIRYADEMEDDGEVYVFASKPVDIGDGKPIPMGKFVRVDRRRVPGLQEGARRKNGLVIAMPPGWTPKDL